MAILETNKGRRLHEKLGIC